MSGEKEEKGCLRRQRSVIARLLSHNSFYGYTLTPPRIDILNALHKAGHPVSPSEIAVALNREPARISRLLYSMVRSGLVHTIETNRYVPLIIPHETSSENRLYSLLFPEADATPLTLDATSSYTETSYDETPECRNVTKCRMNNVAIIQ